jgi:glycosyltransferase involved in cell wall biosynthesis
VKNIFTIVPATHYNAVYDYRIVTPMQALARRYDGLNIYMDPYSAELPMPQRIMGMGVADVVYLHTITANDLYDAQDHYNGQPITRDGAHTWVPPAFVQSFDDDYVAITPSNPGFKGWGFKDEAGNILTGNARLTVRGPDDIVLQDWLGGANVDWERNKFMVDRWIQALKTSQLLISSTPRLATAISEYAPDVKTFVLPNCINFDDFPDLDLMPHDEVRIQWAGSAHHIDDVSTIHAALTRVMTKYDNVRLMWFCDSSLDWAIKDIPEDKITRIPWADFRVYKLRLSSLAPDVFIAPLCDNRFNNAKSAIKFYEGAALTNPAPVVAPNIGEYADIVKHGETGWLYEQFVEHLSTAIEDAKLRKTLAANAKDWVRENRNIDDYARPLWLALEEARQDRRDLKVG